MQFISPGLCLSGHFPCRSVFHYLVCKYDVSSQFYFSHDVYLRAFMVVYRLSGLLSG